MLLQPNTNKLHVLKYMSCSLPNIVDRFLIKLPTQDIGSYRQRMIRVGSAVEFSGKLRNDTVLPHDFGNSVQAYRKSALLQRLLNPRTAVTLLTSTCTPTTSQTTTRRSECCCTIYRIKKCKPSSHAISPSLANRIYIWEFMRKSRPILAKDRCCFLLKSCNLSANAYFLHATGESFPRPVNGCHARGKHVPFSFNLHFPTHDHAGTNAKALSSLAG